MARYRVGLIGLGRIASTIDDEVQGRPSILLPYAHMACYREIPAVEVVAGADPFAEQPPPPPLRRGLEPCPRVDRRRRDRAGPPGHGLRPVGHLAQRQPHARPGPLPGGW